MKNRNETALNITYIYNDHLQYHLLHEFPKFNYPNSLQSFLGKSSLEFYMVGCLISNFRLFLHLTALQYPEEIEMLINGLNSNCDESIVKGTIKKLICCSRQAAFDEGGSFKIGFMNLMESKMFNKEVFALAMNPQYPGSSCSVYISHLSERHAFKKLEVLVGVLTFHSSQTQLVLGTYTALSSKLIEELANSYLSGYRY